MRTFFGLPYTYSIYTVVLFGFDLCMGGAPLCTGDSESLTSVLLGRVVTPDPDIMCSVGSRMRAKISSKDTESLCLLGGGGVIVYMSRNQTWRERLTQKACSRLAWPN